MDEPAALGGGREQTREARIGERLAVVVGQEPEAAHVVRFRAAPQLVLPIGQRGVDGAEGVQHATAVARARRGEASPRRALATDRRAASGRTLPPERSKTGSGRDAPGEHHRPGEGGSETLPYLGRRD
ncbi:MAG: hypothetical protein RLZZ15_3666 [Verrucomicrobiota bacterium]|jgi:hypothetical protein